MKLADFSKIVNGTILGDPETEITGVSGIREAKKGDITYISSPRYMKYLRGSSASCVIMKEPVENLSMAQLIVNNPQYVFAKALEQICPGPRPHPGISGLAVISDKAFIGKDAAILPFAIISDGASIGEKTVISPGVFIGQNTNIGDNCFIHPNVTIRENVSLGNRVIVHSGTVIGSDGFGYVFEGGEHYKIPQMGGVIIEDDVEIGSNVSIDRATTGNTTIGKGTKIDNLVQIAHNVKIGQKSLICAQAGIAGSSVIGDFVTLAGQVGVADHVSIESGTIVGAQSGIPGDLEKGVYSGTPAIVHQNWLRSQSLFSKLPAMAKKLRELEEKINKLEKGMHHDDR